MRKTLTTLAMPVLVASTGWLSAQGFEKTAAPDSPQGKITVRTFDCPGPADRDQFGDASKIIGDGGVGAGECANYPLLPDRIYYPIHFEWPTGPTGFEEDSIELPPENVRDQYVTEIRGFIYLEGTVYFAIAADDPAELWISPDDDPANAILRAIEPLWNPIRAFASEERRTVVDSGTADERLINQTVGIEFTGGPNWIMARSKEMTEDDNLAVAMNDTGVSDFEDGGLPIDGSVLATFDRPDLGEPFLRYFIGGATGFTFELSDGEGPDATIVDPSTITALLDGEEVPLELSRDGAITTGTYTKLDGFLEGGSVHVATIGFNEKTVEKTFVVPTFAVVPPEFDLTGSVDTRQRGFKWRVLQANVEIANSIAERERHLGGLLTDPDGMPLENFADCFDGTPVGPGGIEGCQIEVPGVINFDQAAGSAGVFRARGDGSNRDLPDDWIPGIPGLDNSTENITAEILTVIHIQEGQEGLVKLAVNSADGFKTTAGNVKDPFESIELGAFEGSRSAATTFYDVLFEEPGMYQLRTIWYQGQGDANLEWWSANVNGTPVALLNHTEAGGFMTFRDIPEDPLIVTSISPPNGSSEQPVDGVTITVRTKDGSTSLDISSVTMTFDDGSVTPDVSKTGGDGTISYQTGALVGNTQYHWEVSFMAGEQMRTVGASFRTTLLGAVEFFIETEDFDFDLGGWDQTNEIGMNPPYAGGTYQDMGSGVDEADIDAGTDFGVDYFEISNNNEQAVYRPGTGVEAGKPNGSAGGFRGSFEVETWHIVGWNEPGDWMNYTRNYPEGEFTIYARLSSGGEPIDVSFDRVTSGVGSSSQELELLGHFRPGRATASWDTFEFFPLLNPKESDDEEDSLAQVTFDGGEETLRFTTLGGDNENDYLAFVPAMEQPPVGAITISLNEDGTVRLEGMGSVASSLVPQGPYEGAVPLPVDIMPDLAAQFFRLNP